MSQRFSESAPMVSVEQLQRALAERSVSVFFTSMCDLQTGQAEPLPPKWIPGTQYFDFETVFCDPDSTQPHTLPSAERFEQLVNRLGVTNSSDVVVYDAKGLYSAARVWFMFRYMGHQRVWVLDGGLPAWLEAEANVEDSQAGTAKPKPEGGFIARPDLSKLVDKTRILEDLAGNHLQVVDARSAARFRAQAPEPRAGVRGGHIPGAVNLPFTSLIENGRLKSPAQIQHTFAQLSLVRRPVFSCGSGVTACILALAAEQIGLNEWAVYDGSWSEWGSDHALPLAIG